ncbi:helix-turn-helix domain-containing protein [Roseovarius sp. 2305UL8-3]|uniref:helix-turn-helix domain-containing protein n=1 Tax=Roseovarius conchicola TaxID=3121636 RepID=UPI003527275B
MTFNAWQELGFAIRQARIGRGWNLEKLADKALGNGARKGYVGQVEKGLRNLSPETIDKFDQALSLPEEVVKAAHMAPPPDTSKPDEEKVDRDVERMLSRANKDEHAPQMGETLMIALAYEFAGGKYLDLQTAYVGLRKALEAAENIRKRGEMPSDNTGSQLNSVLAEVAKLNAEGELEKADGLFEAEERRMLKVHKAEQDRMDQQAKALLARRLDQDRLRNDPAAAADHMIRDLMRRAPAGGVWRATQDLLIEWRGRGETQGDPFDLRVALVLANRNLKRAKGSQKGAALSSLGSCRLALGERSSDTAYLEGAEKACRTALKTFSKSGDAENWSIIQSNLGSTLAKLGERATDLEKLRQAIVAHHAALSVCSKDKTPEDWASFQNNLGSALQGLGKRTDDPDLLQKAIAAHHAALSVRSKEKTPEDWATSQSNLGNALQEMGDRTNNPDLLQQAIDAHRTALTVRSKYKTPVNWANSNHNLAIALRSLARLENTPTVFDDAEAAYKNALTITTPENAPYHWADTIGGLGELALDRFAFDPDPKHLDQAEAYLSEAKSIMTTANEYLDDRCDDLLARITEARSSISGI